MLGIALAILAGLSAPQDTVALDAPVYANEAYGVSVPRPYPDWVFEPGSGAQTLTVIFHPRAEPLRDQLWGALILTTFPGAVDLRRVADQRVETTWRRSLGRTYELIASDSLTVEGLPAIRTEMSGAIGHVALDVEEYAIARDSLLIILQLRYPRGLPHDSVAEGYRRVLRGLRIRVAPAPQPTASVDFADSVAATGVVPPSPFEADAYEALVRYDALLVRAEFAARATAVNAGDAPADSLAIWLWPALTLDSVRSATARLRVRTAGSVSWIGFPSAIQPQETAPITVFYHATADPRIPSRLLDLTPGGAHVTGDWLPRLQPETDSAGQPLQTAPAAVTMRFDLPQDWHAVAEGRLTSDAVASGRRLTTWRSGRAPSPRSAFAIGPFRAMTRRDGGPTVSVWLGPADSLSSADVDHLADSVRLAWEFCGEVFGRLPSVEMNLVAANVPDAAGFTGLVFLPRRGSGAPSSADSAGGSPRIPPFGVIAREVARTWWGGSLAPMGPGSAWILESFPSWVAVAAAGVMQGDTARQRLVREAEAAWHALPLADDGPLARISGSAANARLLRSKGVAAIEAARRAIGDARFRESLMLVAVEHRDAWVALSDVLDALGPDAAAVLRPYLY